MPTLKKRKRKEIHQADDPKKVLEEEEEAENLQKPTKILKKRNNKETTNRKTIKREEEKEEEKPRYERRKRQKRRFYKTFEERKSQEEDTKQQNQKGVEEEDKKEEKKKRKRKEKSKSKKEDDIEERQEQENNKKKRKREKMNPAAALSLFMQGRGMGRGGGLDEERVKTIEKMLKGDIMMQLQACQELCTFYSMCQNPTIGNGRMEKFGPMIVNIVQTSQFGDLLLIAVRTLTNMIDAVPEVGEILIQKGLLEGINAKMVNVQFIDVVEQCVSCIAMLAEHYQRVILENGVIEAMLMFLDFHALQVQRKIVSIVANVYRRANETHQMVLMNTKDNMINALHNGDDKIVNYAATAMKSIVYIAAKTEPEKLETIFIEKVIRRMIELIESGESDTVSKCIETMATACKYSPTIVKAMYDVGIEEKIQEMLGNKTTHTNELLNLSLKLLPPIKDSNLILLMNRVKRKKRLTQIVRAKNQKTLLKPFRARRKSKHVELYAKKPDLFIKYGKTLIPEFMSIYQFSADMNERDKTVTIIASILFYSKAETLKNMLKDIPISTFLKHLLSTNHLGHMSAAMDMCRSLMTKLPTIFVTYFMREGVIKEIQDIRGLTLDKLPKQSMFDTLKAEDGAQVEKAKAKHKEHVASRKKDQKKLKKKITDLKKEMKKKEDEGLINRLEQLNFRYQVSSRKPSFEPPLVQVKISKNSRLTKARDNETTYHYSELLDYVIVQSDELMRENLVETQSESTMLVELRSLAKNLLETKDDIFELLVQIRDHFNSTNVTGHEIMESGIFEALAQFLSIKKDNVSLFFSVFYNPYQCKGISSSPYKQFSTTEKFTHLREFVRKTQHCITTLETFQISQPQAPTGFLRFSHSSLSNVFRSVRQPIQISFIPKEKGNPDVFQKIMISPMLNFSRLARLFHEQYQRIQNDETESISSLDEEQEYIVKPTSESEDSLDEVEAIHLPQYDASAPQGRVFIDNYLDKMNDTEEEMPYTFYIGNKEVNPQDSIVKALFQNAPYYKDENDPRQCQFSRRSHDIYYSMKEQTKVVKEKVEPSLHDILSPHMTLQMSSMLVVLEILLRYNTTSSVFPRFLTVDELVPETDFVNIKLDAKLEKQLHDPFIASSGCLPRWWDTLITFTPFLFSYKTRMLYFSSLSQGSGRSLENMLSNASKNRHISGLMHMLSQRTRVIIEHQKIIVDRQNVFSNAFDFFKMEESQSSQKKLEVSFYDEVGTGLGPTLEFYTVLSKSFQSPSLGMWMDETDPKDSTQRRLISINGLIPLPRDPSKTIPIDEELFHFLGVFMARALIDKRLIDIPLSPIVLLFLSGRPIEHHHLSLINPHVQKLMVKFKKVIEDKHHIESNEQLSPEERTQALAELKVDNAPIESFELTFTLPGYDILLKPNGDNLLVTLSNLEEYVSLVYRFFLDQCISRQLNALRSGFSTLVDPSNLDLFSISELNGLFLGEDVPWTVELLLRSTHCDHGYTPSTGVVQHLFEVLSSFSPSERRSFLKFVTGSPRLPIGGLAALDPPLTIVRKTTPENPDSYLPSVMTCTNYLKLPHYSSKSILAQQLSQAIANGQHAFHLS